MLDHLLLPHVYLTNEMCDDLKESLSVFVATWLESQQI